MKHLIYLLVVVSTFLSAATEPTILFEEDSSLLTATIQMVALTGSQNDPIKKIGLSNLMSELMLRGTKKRNRTKFQKELERMGASLSVTTAHDRIVFTGTVIKENISNFIVLLEDCLVQPAFNEAEFKSLQSEIINEITYAKNQNRSLGGLLLRRELFSGTPLERPTTGSLSTVKAITLVDVQKQYNNYFHRPNLVFAVSSPIPESELNPKLKAVWLKLPDGPRYARKTIPLKVPKAPELIVIHKPDTSTGSLVFAQGGITAQDPARYTLQVGNFAFGSEPLVSRLFRIVRSELGWTYGIGSSYNAMGSLTDQQGLFTISAIPSVEYTVKTILKVTQLWNQYLEAGVSGPELKLAQESLINSYPFESDSAEKRLSRKLYNYLYNVPILSPEEYEKTIDAISNRTILSALKEKQTPSGWLMLVVADKTVIEKQLETEQKDIPVSKRISIKKVVTPDEVVN